MFKRTKVCSAALVALGGALTAVSLPALAQQQTAERVEVTGSRIKTTETEGASPVITLSAESIKVEAVRNVETLLNNLPQVFADFGAQVSNGATGTASVNLRNLGATRTLVLVNGRRVPAGSPGSPGTSSSLAADLNQIPASLIRRVEVLTGGASAVYGADAVAGVVNFIMNDRFEGIQVEVNHQFYNHQQGNPKNVQEGLRLRNFPIPGDIDSDGEVTDLSVTMGGNFANGKGNATLFFGYKKEAALLQSERDFSACQLNTRLSGTAFGCGGSGTAFPARAITDFGDFIVADAQGTLRPRVGTDVFNFGPINYYQRPSDRYQIAAFGRYDINEMARAYLETSFHDDSTVAQIAPSGLFGVLTSVSFDNPLLSQSWRDALFGPGQGAPGDTADAIFFRRNVEGGGRQDDIRHSSFRVVGGLRGDIGPWSYDAFAQVGKVIYQNTYKNDFSITRGGRALDVVADPATGNPVCRSVLDGSDPNCVPYNIFSLGQVTPDALTYLQTPGFKKGFTSQNILGASATVDLGQYGVKLPTAQSGVGLALGVERRQEKLQLDTDTAFTTGDLAGQGGSTISVAGQYSVRDVFAELRLPVMEKQPLAELLNVNASYRNSDYSTGKKTDTYGVGMEWAPIRAVKLRGSVQRAVRAPNVQELFAARSPGLITLTEDPCAGPTPTRSLAECARTGVTAGQYGTIQDNPAGQYNAIFGGNPNLNPETGDSLTVGVVFQPSRDLDVTVDYFDIELKEGIGIVTPELALERCLDTGNPTFCNLIRRDRLGSLWILPEANIDAGNSNLARQKTQGMDIGVNWRTALAGFGQVETSFIGTYLKKNEFEPIPGEGTYDCAGYHGAGFCGTPNPKWRHKLRATWSTPWNLDVSLTWRHISKIKDEGTSSNSLLSGNPPEIQREFSAMNYFDVSAKYDITKNLTFRLGVANLFDKDPPLSSLVSAVFGNGNTYPVVYDALGRRISLNLTATF